MGADSLELLAVHLGMLEEAFTVTEPVELVGQLRSLAERCGRATAAQPKRGGRRRRTASGHWI